MKKQVVSLFFALVCFLSITIGCMQSSTITAISTQTVLPTETPPITTTPTLDFKKIIFTPENIFSLPEIAEWNTPTSGDFCEHLPEPQIVRKPNDFLMLSGKFVLCIYERSFMAIDLDTGKFVFNDFPFPSDDEISDIIMLNGRFGTNEDPDYAIFSQNRVLLNDAYVIEKYNIHSGENNLSYKYCKDILQNHAGSVMDVDVNRVACVKTNEGRISMLQVNKIYPSLTLSVEFSFVVFKDE